MSADHTFSGPGTWPCDLDDGGRSCASCGVCSAGERAKQPCKELGQACCGCPSRDAPAGACLKDPAGCPCHESTMQRVDGELVVVARGRAPAHWKPPEVRR